MEAIPLDDNERKAKIDEFVEMITETLLPLDDDGIYLGSVEDYPLLTEDEWIVDEINELLNEHGVAIEVNEGVGQVALNLA